MKIYFEQRSWGGDNIDFDIYIKPFYTQAVEGAGLYYNSDGKLCSFYWVHPEKAKVFDDKELPKELLYSFKHGTRRCSVDAGKKNNWTFDDLIYDKVTPEMTRAYNKLMKELDKVTTIEEYHKLYPLILKGNRINEKVMDTFFKIQKVPDIPVVNGEIGIAFYMKCQVWKAMINKLGWDNENSNRH